MGLWQREERARSAGEASPVQASDFSHFKREITWMKVRSGSMTSLPGTRNKSVLLPKSHGLAAARRSGDALWSGRALALRSKRTLIERAAVIFVPADDQGCGSESRSDKARGILLKVLNRAVIPTPDDHDR